MPVNTLASDWNRELGSPVFRARFRAAREAEPALSRFVDAVALVRFMRRPAAPGEKDAVLCALLALGEATSRWAGVSCLRRSAPAC